MQHPFRDSANCVDALDRNKEKSLLYNRAAITHKMVRYAQNFLSWHIIKDEAHDFIIAKNNVDIMLKYVLIDDMHSRNQKPLSYSLVEYRIFMRLDIFMSRLSVLMQISKLEQ